MYLKYGIYYTVWCIYKMIKTQIKRQIAVYFVYLIYMAICSGFIHYPGQFPRCGLNESSW